MQVPRDPEAQSGPLNRLPTKTIGANFFACWIIDRGNELFAEVAGDNTELLIKTTGGLLFTSSRQDVSYYGTTWRDSDERFLSTYAAILGLFTSLHFPGSYGRCLEVSDHVGG